MVEAAEAPNPVTQLLQRIESDVAAHLEPVRRSGQLLIALQVGRAVVAAVAPLYQAHPDLAASVLAAIEAADAHEAELLAEANALNAEPVGVPAEHEPSAEGGAATTATSGAAEQAAPELSAGAAAILAEDAQ